MIRPGGSLHGSIRWNVERGFLRRKPRRRYRMNRGIDYGLIDRVRLRFPLFYPAPDRSRAPEGATDHLIEVAPGVFLGARHYRGQGGFPTVLYFHGNGEVVGDHD